ncbi:MAG: SusD/RagB family nutrient-binding outer membrane lipoprotein [Saprospiraceae bacterium]|nr:SusD/RagB family nutrient-binding outer membrane lipoprotein [Saprospiraceae bacterium]
MKNFIKYIRLSALALLVLAMSACSDDLVELNVDPNNPTDVPASNLFTQGTYLYFDNVHSRTLNAEWGMLMVQHWAQNEYTEEQRYDVDGNDYDFVWNEYYAESLNELKTAREFVVNDENLTETQRANQLACIDIMMAQVYQSVTDSWGDIPYTQALDGLNFPNPAYDSQESIYNSLLSSLDNAVNSIDESVAGFAIGDPIYEGDMSKWKAFGASLMLRMAIRVSDVDDATASEYAGKAGPNVISSMDQNAIFNFSEEPALANPNWEDVVLNTRDDFCVTEGLVQTLRDMGDPRLEVFAKPNNSGDIVGMPYGLTDGAAFALKDISSRPTDLVRQKTSPHLTMDLAQTNFFRAEAVERGYMSGDAEAMYNAAVRASMNMWGITDDAAIDDYLANNPYDSGNWQQSIGVQKWIHLYTNGLEAWAEWRRLDYPELDPSADAVGISEIPKSLPYPTDEQTRNGSSLSDVTGNPDDLTNRMWWDVN